MHRMTNLAHWQDDIDEALGGDFDGSLSGLCIMSLSFDFTRNGNGSQLGLNKETSTANSNNNNSNNNNNNNNSAINELQAHQASSSSSKNLSNTCSNQNAINIDENSIKSCFKRFKSSSTINDRNNDEEEDRSSGQNIIVRQLQQLQNCLSTSLANNGNLMSSYTSAVNTLSQTQTQLNINEFDNYRQSPKSPEISSDRNSNNSTPSSSSSETSDEIRSPSQTISSISTHSRTSSRSQSPSDMSIISCNDENSNDDNITTTNNINASNINNISTNNINTNNTSINNNNNNNINGIVKFNQSGQHNSNRNMCNLNEQRASFTNDNQQVSLYSSVKDSIFNGGTFKESSYTTSVITTTAPMPFKSLHHSFSIKQFPPSPFHQLSNSHDFYDRYMSLDSHQPLQTPLIGIERTQDFLSLKLPPHGTENVDSNKFPKDWPFEESKQDHLAVSNNRLNNNDDDNVGKDRNVHSNDEDDACGNNINKTQTNSQSKDFNGRVLSSESEKGFPFNYKSTASTEIDIDNDEHQADQREPIDLNVNYGEENCCEDEDKDTMFNESMKHFNPNRVQQGATDCYNLRSKQDHTNQAETNEDDGPNISNQYNGQETMFGIDPRKQKFQYVLAAPISIATKLTEDTMTYLNQGQAYEIKLENTTDVSEAKKCFMCSIINIGFHERHMQQAENELWQQWSHQHPNEKIFSVDIKLSYNVFGVAPDGLNKYKFLWDSSKAAGIFIRINSISTEFTLKKHGGEKGVPFKLSIETFSYNSKTHDSYFISAACCQIKVFKPKGAERKIRSDRDKVYKKPLSEQEKYHKSCDYTSFREFSLNSLHPITDSSLSYYRNGHSHFASKQVIPSSSVGGNSPGSQATTSTATNVQNLDELERANTNNSSQQDHHSPTQQQQQQRNEQQNSDRNQVSGSESDSANNGHNSQQDYRIQNHHHNQNPRSQSVTLKTHTDYSTNRLLQNIPHANRVSLESSDHQSEQNFGFNHHHHHPTSDNNSNFNHSTELLQPFNQMYHSNQVRNVPGLPMKNTQHFGMSYYGHSIAPPTIPSHIPPPPNYSLASGNSFSTIAHQTHSAHNFSVPSPHLSAKGVSSIYRQMNTDKSTIPVLPNNSNFRASNLALASHHTNSLQNNYHMNNHNSSTTPDNQNQDLKESNLNNTNNVQTDNSTYDSTHTHHHHHHHNPFQASNQQLSTYRQLGISTSLSQTNSHCTNYSSNQPTQTRHTTDNYGGHTNSNDNASTTNNSNNNNNSNTPVENTWTQSMSVYPQIPSSNCTNKTSSISSLPSQSQENPTYDNGNGSYDCNSQNFDSAHSSPQKTAHQTNDSTSYQPKFKLNPTASVFSTLHDHHSPHNQNHPSPHHHNHPQLEITHISPITISINSDCNEVAAWFTANRFNMFSRTFNNFSGSDILRLSKAELIEICGLIDGIRLFNSIHNQPIRPRRVLYVCHEGSEFFHPIYLYEVSLKELLRDLSDIHKTFVNEKKNQSPEVRQKSLGERPTLNSSSSTDSRSSIGGLSMEAGSDDVYNQNEHYFNRSETPRRKFLASGPKSPNRSEFFVNPINRLLIDGLTTVRIVATEKVVQVLEDESVWKLSINYGASGMIEACMSACQSNKRQSNRNAHINL